MKTLLQHVTAAGFPLEPASIINLFIGGSQLHGAKVQGYDDLDIYGCYIEPPHRILGLQPIEHFVWSSGSQHEKNTADDVDITMYSLRKWGQLILKGNPAILHFLFAPIDQAKGQWLYLRDRREQFLSKKAARQYLGFAENQRMRLTGERGKGRHGQRPDLIAKYGYDVKFAMHYIRLLFECRELLMNHHLTLPRPMDERQQLIDIRQGQYTQDEVFREGQFLMNQCELLLDKSDLPDHLDVHFVSDIITRLYLTHWEGAWNLL